MKLVMTDNMDGRFSNKQDTSEKLKAKQYGAAVLFCLLVVIIMTIISWIWGSATFGSGQNEVSLSFIIYCVRSMVLLFGGIDLISAVYHFVLWNRNGRPCMEDDNNSIFSDWKGGERSPVKVSLTLMAGAMVLVLLLVIQG